MRSTDERRAAALRLRSAAPIAGLAAPALLLAIAGVVSALAGDDAARWWIAAASPMTAIVLSAHRSLGVVPVLMSVLAAVPLWSALGVVMARRTIFKATKDQRLARAFWRRYAIAANVFALLSVVLFHGGRAR